MKGLIATVIVLAQPISNANAATYLFHNDHLGTPQVLTDSDQQVVWQSEQDPFGEVEEVVNVVEQNLRFAGQYFDVETGLHYNYFRDYDSSIGRYVQSDPIGLGGGLTTYAYVDQNPLVFTDPLGLSTLSLCKNPKNYASCRAANLIPKKKLPKIKKPKKPKGAGQWRCTCRAISNQESNNGDVQTAFGTATNKSFSKCQSNAKKQAKDMLGKQAKHDSCVCVNSKGDIKYTKGG